MAKRIYIGGRFESVEQGNVVAGANAILDDTKGKKQNVINAETDTELLRLQNEKQDNLTFDNAPTEGSSNPVKSGGVYTANQALQAAIEAIMLLIPNAASELNKLVDTNLMNSSISTATATFRGTYNVVTDLGLTYQATHEQIAAVLDALVTTADNNDYCFVQIPTNEQSSEILRTERFKNNGTNWGFEYDLNTSGFTAAQWAAINSGITALLVGKLGDLPTAAELNLLLGQKQDNLTFDNEPTALSNNPVKSGGVYAAIQTVLSALTNYQNTTDPRITTIEGKIPSGASAENQLTDKSYVDGIKETLQGYIDAINTKIPAEAAQDNKLADKNYVQELISSIMALIPEGASGDNQLVDTAAMVVYVTGLMNAIDASFNVTSTDGHITLHITQENGAITSVLVQSSGIASAADLTLVTGRVTAAENNIISLGGQISSIGTDIANLQQLYNNLQQSKPVAVTALPTSGQQQGVIYRLAGTTSYSDYMWNGSTWVLMATYNNAIDDVPTPNSNNLVKSGGIIKHINTNSANSRFCDSPAEFSIGDPKGNVIMEIDKGEIKTRNFSTLQIGKSRFCDSQAEFSIGDKKGNIILQVLNGYIKTKNFDSEAFSAGESWAGKKWYCYGTSLTALTNPERGKYTNYVAQFSGLEQFNKGLGGKGICTSGYDETAANFSAICNITDGKLDADLITIEVGANDSLGVLGDIYDDTDNSTLCGALNLCIRYLQENTTAQIAVISSWMERYNVYNPAQKYSPEDTFGSDNHTWLDLYEKIEKVCKMNSAYYIPMGETAGMSMARMNGADGDDFLIDNIHPTPLGAYNMALFVWSRLRQIPVWYKVLSE